MYEDALTKALQVEMDEDIPAYPMNHRFEENLKSVQKYLKELSQESGDLVYQMLDDRSFER